MGRELYETHPLFANFVDSADLLLSQGICGDPLGISLLNFSLVIRYLST